MPTMNNAKEEIVPEGGCLCGAIRCRVTGKLRDVVNRHSTYAENNDDGWPEETRRD